jgi:hypothetical protein
MLREIFQWAAFWLLNTAVVLAVYVIWVRPLLKRNPSLAWFWDRETSLFAAIRAKLAGLKQRLTTAVVSLAIGVVYMHDLVAPMLTGVDTTPFTDMIAAYVPRQFWGIGVVGLLMLLNYFRSLADKRGDA